MNLILIALIHGAAAVIEWRTAARRERPATLLLIGVSLCLAILASAALGPPNPWQWVKAVFSPVGTPFLHVSGG